MKNEIINNTSLYNHYHHNNNLYSIINYACYENTDRQRRVGFFYIQHTMYVTL